MYKKYQNPDIIVRVADGTLIPKDDGNRDYQEARAYFAAGGELLPADEPQYQPPAPAAD